MNYGKANFKVFNVDRRFVFCPCCCDRRLEDRSNAWFFASANTGPPHGNIMVGAFLDTLIIFERMLALPVKWLLWVPFLWALSSLTVHLEP
jgi:hypothetical protein